MALSRIEGWFTQERLREMELQGQIKGIFKTLVMELNPDLSISTYKVLSRKMMQIYTFLIRVQGGSNLTISLQAMNIVQYFRSLLLKSC